MTDYLKRFTKFAKDYLKKTNRVRSRTAENGTHDFIIPPYLSRKIVPAGWFKIHKLHFVLLFKGDTCA